MNPTDRKNEIVRAAIKCFAERGYHSTQISDIIAEAGIARGTFYLYFESKHEIFQHILDDFIAHISAQIKDITIGGSESPAMQLRQNAERIVDAVLSQPEIGKILFNRAVGLDHDIDSRLGLFYKRLLGIIASSIKKGIAFGLVNEIHPDVAACVVLGAFREILVQNTIFGNTQIDRDKMLEGLSQVLLTGLGGKNLCY